MMQEFEIIAKTFQGLEEVLAKEITELGANNVQIGNRMVSFTGDKLMLYRANFCLRTAVRILKPIKRFTAKDADEVYAAVRQIEWSDYFDLQTTFAVDSVVYSEEFRHSKFVAYKVKDAIIDYFRETTGERPNIRITNPDVKLHIHISEEDCTLSLDSSGESLHQRGYRVASVEAPINEVLAAGLIKLSGWQADCDFVDPFCGSGTFLVEAALMARNIYPGVFRKEFGFEKWKDFEPEILQAIFEDDSQEREFAHHIYGSDLNFHAVEAALRNVRNARVEDIVTVRQQDIRNFERPSEKYLIVTNPPYGERLVTPDLLGLYQALGKTLKHECTGCEAWIISSKQELFDSIGLRASFKVQVFNGKLDCDFRKYQLFEGKLGDYRADGGIVKTDEERRVMGDHRRFRRDREDFKQRHDEPLHERENEADLDPQYLILRQKHREFEENQFSKNRARFRDGFRDGSRDGFRKKDFGRKWNDAERGGDFRKRDGFKGGGFKRDGFKGDGFKRDGFRKGGFRKGDR